MNGSSIPTHTKYNRLGLGNGNECNRALGMYIKYIAGCNEEGSQELCKMTYYCSEHGHAGEDQGAGDGLPVLRRPADRLQAHAEPQQEQALQIRSGRDHGPPQVHILLLYTWGH